MSHAGFVHREGINWADIEWVDNSQCLDLIERVSPCPFFWPNPFHLLCAGPCRSWAYWTCWTRRAGFPREPTRLCWRSCTGLTRWAGHCRRGGAGHGWVRVVYCVCCFQDNPYYCKPKVNVAKFGIRHYAGEVTYEVDGLLEKNRDTFRDDILKMLKESRWAG